MDWTPEAETPKMTPFNSLLLWPLMLISNPLEGTVIAISKIPSSTVRTGSYKLQGLACFGDKAFGYVVG